jgi:hypothetical protein
MHRAGVLLVVLFGLAMPVTVHSQGRTPSGPVGASMALLATLQEAAILPPEGSVQANRIVQMVIQFQGLFMKSTDPAVRQFMDEALTAKFSARAAEVGAEFRKAGWTSQVVEALCDHYANITAPKRTELAESFARVNMRPEDFELLSDLYVRARSTLKEQGRDIHRIFAEHRRNMPGGKRFERKERRDGDEGLHTHQGEDGAHKRRAAVVKEACRSGTSPFLLWPTGHLPLYHHAG